MENIFFGVLITGVILFGLVVIGMSIAQLFGGSNGEIEK